MDSPTAGRNFAVRAKGIGGDVPNLANVTKLYRSMTEDDDGHPVLSDTNQRGLGVRVPWDIEIDEDGIVHPGTGGVSVAPDSPSNLPPYMHPPSLGGDAQRPVWELDSDDLPVGVEYEHEPKHGLLTPAYSMDLEDFRTAIQETRDGWVKHV